MLDISQQPMEVALTAHYSMGGVVVDPRDHATDVAGLYAAGEIAAGLHGAEPAGRQLSGRDGRVWPPGREAAARYSASRDGSPAGPRGGPGRRPGAVRFHPPWAPVRPTLQRGAPRHHVGDLVGWSVTSPDCGTAWSGWPSCAGWPPTLTSGRPPRATATWPTPWTRARLPAAEATLLGRWPAASRGAHQRRDHPELDPALRVNFQARLVGTGRLTVNAWPVPAVPAELAGWTRPDPT